MTINQWIKTDELNSKWFKYGFKYVTGIVDDNIDRMVSFLKGIKGYTDKDIVQLVNATYTPAGMTL